MYYSRPFKQDQPSSSSRGGYLNSYNDPPSHQQHHQRDQQHRDQREQEDWYPQHGGGPGLRPNPQAGGPPQQESITGMLNNFSKALGDIRDIREKRMKSLGNSPRPSPTTEQQNQMTYNRTSNSMQHNFNNKMMMQQPQQYSSNRNQMQYNQQQQQPMQQQQRNMQQQQPPYQQQNMMQPQQQQQPQQQNQFRQQNQQNQQPMMMGGGGGGYQQNQQQQQQPQGMYNHAGGGGGGGMYNNQPQQVGRQQQQQQMPQQQGYLNQQSGNYQQQSSLVVSANHTGSSMGMQPQQQQRMQQQQQQPMMMQPQQQQQQQPMMMSSQQQQQPMMQQMQPQQMVNRFATPYGVEQHQTMQQAPQYQYEVPPQPYVTPQAPLVQPQMQQQPMSMMQPAYSYQTTGSVPLQPSQPMQAMSGIPQGYVMTSVGSGAQPTSSLVVAGPQVAPAAAPPPTIAYVSQSSLIPQPQATVLNPNLASSYLAVQQPTTTLLSQLPHSQATIQVQSQPHQVISGQPGSIFVHQPSTGQPTNLIVSAAPPTLTTDQLQAAAAAAAAASIGLPTTSMGHHGLLDPSTLTPQQQQLFQQMQLQHQAQHLKKMRQRLPHVSGEEMRMLQKQISDLQQQQQMQQLQTLRLAQKQEQQTFKYLNKAIKNRPSRTYQSRFTKAKPTIGSSMMYHSNTSHIPSAALLGGATLAMSGHEGHRSGRGLGSSMPNRVVHSQHHTRHKGGGGGVTGLEAALLQAARHQHGAQGSPFATPVGTPDTLSETGSMKSRSRRTLPYLPPEEPAPLPTQAKKAQERMRAFANFRQSSLDGLTSGRVTSFSGGFFGGPSSKPRPSSSESNLRKLAMSDAIARPGSALGLIQGKYAASSVVSSHGPTSATREHEKRILESILPPDLRHLVRGGSPATIQQIKSKLEEDMKLSSESGHEAEIARRNAERRLFGGSLGSQTERIRQEMQRYASMRDPVLRAKMKHNLNPVMNAQLDRNRRMRTHRRNLSDPRFSTSLTDSLDDDPFAYTRPYSALARDYDPMSDGLGMDNSRSYLGGRSLSGPDGMASLRDTAINSNAIDSEDRNRYLASRSRQLLRRSSDGGLAVLDPLVTRNFDVGMSGSPLAARRAHSSMSGRYPRSWHPSPFASDDDASSDEPQFFKEEKKNRIKMEIARRRQQIEENACLHDELTRLARLRENAEITDRLHPSATSQSGLLYGTSPGIYNPAAMPGSGVAVSSAGTSVLKSVDEILRDGHHNDLSAYPHRTNHYQPSSASRFGRNYDSLYPDHGMSMNPSMGNHPATGSGYPHTDMYTGSTYDRVTDFSPINSEPQLMGEMTPRRHYDMDAYTSAGAGGKYSKFASYK